LIFGDERRTLERQQTKAKTKAVVAKQRTMRASKTQRRARELFFVLFTLEDEGLKSNHIKRRAYLEEEEEEEEENHRKCPFENDISRVVAIKKRRKVDVANKETSKEPQKTYRRYLAHAFLRRYPQLNRRSQ
jgi:hypothetical protein